jgi:oligopeptide/dipeptide ABC transporter ATP-binding protein
MNAMPDMRVDAATAGPPLLQVRNLGKRFPAERGLFGVRSWLHAVDGISFDVFEGETLGLVGESGCGKSTTGNLLMHLTRPSAGSIAVRMGERDLGTGASLRDVSKHIQMVFQDPLSSLNPRLTAAGNVTEPLRIHRIGSPASRRARAAELFAQVGLREDHLDRMPSEFSGGQRQRICIARALALRPRLVILDEPVSALDVSVQAQVLNLLRGLQREFGLSYVFVSHDLSVVRYICDRVAVMYLGKIVEIGTRQQIFERPRHHYTRALLGSVPVLDPTQRDKLARTVLTGDLPSPVNPPSGCRFRTRCPKAQPLCAQQEPKLGRDDAQSSDFACHFPAALKERVGAAA